MPGLRIEPVPPDRFPAREPACRRDFRDFVQQPDGGNPAAHHDNVEPPKLLGGNIVGYMKLAACERKLARIDRPERPGPGPCGIDDCAGRPAAVGRCNSQPPCRISVFAFDGENPDGPLDGQADLALVGGEVPAQKAELGSVGSTSGCGFREGR